MYRIAAVILLLTPLVTTAAPPLQEVETHKNLAYRTDKDADANRHKLDITVPKGGKDLPVLFFVHGGAWKYGDKWTFAEQAKAFAARGVCVVATNYRFSPGVKHPAHIEDVAAAFAWTVENIARHGGDPKKIVVSGHSAGGHLVSLLATNETYLKAVKMSFANIRGVIGISGVYQVDHRVKLFHDIFGDSEEAAKSASPIEHVSEKHPPFLLIYADKDLGTLGRQADKFGEKLKAAKCEATVTEYRDRNHISILLKATTEEDPAFAAMMKFLGKHTGK